MNVSKLPSIIYSEIFSNLTIFELNTLSSVNKFFNKICKEYNPKCFKKFHFLSNKIMSLEMYPELFCPMLTINNFIAQSTAWKNIIFFMLVNSSTNEHVEVLKNYVPKNIMVSLLATYTDVSFNLSFLNPSIEILDCPFKMISCPKHISNNLKYINLSENIYIPSHIDFSGEKLEVIHMNMCNLTRNTFNFSKTLKTISIFGCTGVKNLNGFEYVENLNMDYCDEIESVSPLIRVKELSMRHCSKIKDLSALQQCVTLDISHTNVSDISSLNNLKKVSVDGLEKITFNVRKHGVVYLP